MFCNSALGEGCSTDKESYQIGDTVEITVEGLSGGLWPFVGELVIGKVTDGGHIGVRLWRVLEGIDMTFDWDQTGSTTDPEKGPFHQVEPGFYEILWYPCGVHGYEVLCRFQILAPIVGGTTLETQAFRPHITASHTVASVLVAVIFAVLRRKAAKS